MWTKENRTRYSRDKLRYPSDLIDAEWSLVEPLIAPAERGGNKRRVNLREIVNGRSKLCKQRLRRVMYVLSTGCQWRAIRKDLPPRSTVFAYLDLWIYDGTLDRMHHALYEACREQVDREASPTAAIIDRKTREERRNPSASSGGGLH
jgi:transposase